MSEDQGLRYETYTAKSLAVFGDRDRYDSIMKTIGARWNDKMRCGAGWMLNREHEDKLKQLIGSLGQPEGSEPISLTEDVKPKGKKGKKKTQADVVPEPLPEPQPAPVAPADAPTPQKGKRSKKDKVDVAVQPVVVEQQPVVVEQPVVKRKYTKKVKEVVQVPEPLPEPVHVPEPEPVIAHEPESEPESSSSEDKAEEVSDSSSASDSTSEASDVSDYVEEDQSDDSRSYVSTESEYDPRATKHNNHREEKIDHRKIINPNQKLHKKSKETFISRYVNSDDEVDPEESRKILEKYQKLFQFFKSFSEKPDKFDHEKVRRMRD